MSERRSRSQADPFANRGLTPFYPSRLDLSRRSFIGGIGFSTAALSLLPSTLRGFVTPPAGAGCGPIAHSPFSPGLEKFWAKLQPGSDQFISEKYAAEIEAALAAWTAALQTSPRNLSALASFIAPAIEFSPLAAIKAEPIRDSGPIRVQSVEFTGAKSKGREAFLKSFESYAAAFKQIVTAEFQVSGLLIKSQSPLVVETTLRYDFAGHLEGRVREERTGVWSLTWQMGPGTQWQACQWDAARETRASVTGPGFVEITGECLAGNSSHTKQLLYGVDYWRSVIDAAAGIDVYGNNGVAVGDIDGDGFDDFYVCQPSGLPNRLYRNRGDGTFEDVTDASGLGILDGTASALFADFTNSGKQDLIVVRTSGPQLYLNRGGGRFEWKPGAFRFAKPPAGTFTGVAAADYDRDGFLDVYFCLYAYYQGLSQYTHPQPYYDAQNGPPNFLLRNRGDGVFDDVTAASGMNRNNNRFTFACGWCDYDNDGWPDLYVANDFGRKNLYRNNRNGTFSDIAEQAAVEDFGAGMSVSWADYDNDGRHDLYVTDMYSAAGKRVTSQDAFLPGVDPAIRSAYRKHANGNSLFHNQGPGQPFADVSQQAHVAMGRWSWAADAWDFDHDGYADLYVTDGFISGPDRRDLSSFFWRQIVARSLDTGSGSTDYELAWNAINELIRSDYTWNGYERNVFFFNNRNGTFAEIAGPLGLDFVDDSRAFALADFDHDGRLEVLLKNRSGPQLRILHNDLESIGASVTFRLKGTKSNRDAVGAVVTVESNSIKQVKFVQAGSGFLSQHTKELSFGLGSATAPVRVTVQWPAGSIQTFEAIPIQHRVLITEGLSGFEAEPYRAHAPAQRPHAVSPPEVLPSRFESWLIEPLPAPDFSLPDLNGQTHSLKSFSGQPLVLSLVNAGCQNSRGQLARLQQSSSAFHRQSVFVAAIDLDGNAPPMREFARRGGIQFPILTAAKSTTGIYGILYRYLFDRRRDLETPVTFLLDPAQAIVKLYQGEIDAETILKDCGSIPVGEEARLNRALPFKGQFKGEPPHRNYFTYGVAYIQNEYPDAALACFQASIARNPNYAAAYYNTGTIYLNKQMFPEAKASLERAVSLDPQDADALTNLGAIAGQQKDYDAAYQYFEQAVRIKPAHLVALQNLVMLDRWKGQLGHAQQAIENAIAADPNDPEFHFALGMLLASQEKFEDARRELERTMQLRPNDSVALNNLGVVFLRLGNATRAFDDFERCIQIAPEYDRPYLNIASIYQQRGQPGKAQDILKGFLARHPGNTELAQALQSLGR